MTSEDEKILNEEITEEKDKETEDVSQEDPSEAAPETAKEAAPEEAEDEEEAQKEDGKEEKPKEKSGKRDHRFFGKKEPKKDPRDDKIAELTDRLQRLMAEFDNYRKRTEKEKLQQYDMGVSSTVAKLLPMVDSFDRGLATMKESDPDSPVVAGMDQIYKQLKKALDEIGVEEMDAEGKVFDPNFHNAVIMVENEELESGTVAAELQKGYLYKGKVIRPSTVSVVQ